MRFFYFLFFKQKTAYEMRISDWSSDVCSSDLLQLGFEDPGVGPCLDEQRIFVTTHAPDRFGPHLLFEFDSVLRDPDHLLGDLDVDIGSLDLLRDIEPDGPPVRLGEDHAPFGERHARRPLATAFDRLRIGDGPPGMLDTPITPNRKSGV